RPARRTPSSGGERAPVREAGRVVSAHRGVLEEPPALGAVEGGPGDVVDHPEGDAGDDARVGQVVDGVVHPATATPLAVRPVGVAAVAGTDVEGGEAEGLDLESERLAATLGQADRRTLGVARARPVADLHLRPAELLDRAVRPD